MKIDPNDVREAVQEYNCDPRYRREDAEMWKDAAIVREAVSNFRSIGQQRLESFVWHVRAWGRLRSKEAERTPVASILGDLPLTSIDANTEDFGDVMAHKVVALLDSFVSRSRESAHVDSNHYSWLSKILHWVFPNQVPVYDQRVRECLGISTEGSQAYREIVTAVYDIARQLLPNRESIVGYCEPRFLVRAVDKYLWITADYQQALKVLARKQVTIASDVLSDLKSSPPNPRQVSEYAIDHLVIEGKSQILEQVAAMIRRITGTE